MQPTLGSCMLCTSDGAFEPVHCSFVIVIFFDACSDDSFGDDDALVACRQLGFTRGSALYQYTLNATFPVKGGDGPVWLDDLACNASVHTAVEQCPSNGWGINDCSHIEDVGVYCQQPSKPVSCMSAWLAAAAGDCS
jgi:hypothetical protein